MRRTRLCHAAVLAFVFAAPARAQEPVRYVVRFSQPHTHYFEVSATVPAGRPAVELFMAVWTPGSYLVHRHRGCRDARNSKLPRHRRSLSPEL